MSTPSNYHMIGADGREYGPVSGDQLRQWIKEGRADRFTQVRPEGESWWKPLGQFSEFAELLPQPSASAPPPGGGTAVPSQPPPAPPPMAPMPVPEPLAGSYPAYGGPPKVDGMVVAGLVLSGLGLVCCCTGPFFSPLGLAFSLIGLNNINKDPVNRTGKGLAIAGIVLGALGSLLVITSLLSRPWDSAPFHELIRELQRL